VCWSYMYHQYYVRFPSWCNASNARNTTLKTIIIAYKQRIVKNVNAVHTMQAKLLWKINATYTTHTM